MSVPNIGIMINKYDSCKLNEHRWAHPSSRLIIWIVHVYMNPKWKWESHLISRARSPKHKVLWKRASLGFCAAGQRWSWNFELGFWLQPVQESQIVWLKSWNWWIDASNLPHYNNLQPFCCWSNYSPGCIATWIELFLQYGPQSGWFYHRTNVCLIIAFARWTITEQ